MRVRIPTHGRPREEVLNDLEGFRSEDAAYADGRTFSLVYYLGEEHTRFLQEVYGRFFSENALNPMAFRSLKRMESEVVSMASGLLGGDDRTCGVMTSGGTESCLLAVKTYRDWARRHRPWVLAPEMVVPETIHVAFEKAADYFGVRAVHAPLDPDKRVSVHEVRKRIGRNTILIVGSAPGYPFGVIDPIPELSDLALRKGLPLHVDACLGGFLLPFLERAGHPVPPFDFRIPGVTSISADLHKYGFTAKGASVLLYRRMDHMRHQFFVYENWPGGIFASPALLGTRPGGAIAAAWATMQTIGESGYVEIARTIHALTKRFVEGIDSIPGLEVVGRPDMSVVAYASRDPDLSIYVVGDLLEAKGWHIDRQQRPESLHLMVTPAHVRSVDRFLADLRAAVEEARADPSLAARGSTPMYGMIAHIPIRRLIRSQVLKMMMDFYGPNGAPPNLEGAGGSDDLATRAGRAFLKWRKRLPLLNRRSG